MRLAVAALTVVESAGFICIVVAICIELIIIVNKKSRRRRGAN